jgi:hypothetical protein
LPPSTLPCPDGGDLTLTTARRRRSPSDAGRRCAG